MLLYLTRVDDVMCFKRISFLFLVQKKRLEVNVGEKWNLLSIIVNIGKSRQYCLNENFNDSLFIKWGIVYTDAASNRNGFMTSKPHRNRHGFEVFTRNLSNRLGQTKKFLPRPEVACSLFSFRWTVLIHHITCKNCLCPFWNFPSIPLQAWHRQKSCPTRH